MVRLLVADPKQRLSMEGIKKHPWFLEQLPAGSLQMNGFYKHCPSGLEQVQPSSARRAVPPHPWSPLATRVWSMAWLRASAEVL